MHGVYHARGSKSVLRRNTSHRGWVTDRRRQQIPPRARGLLHCIRGGGSTIKIGTRIPGLSQIIQPSHGYATTPRDCGGDHSLAVHARKAVQCSGGCEMRDERISESPSHHSNTSRCYSSTCHCKICSNGYSTAQFIIAKYTL